MSWWLLLLFLFIVWCLWASAATARVAAHNARRPLPDGYDRGVRLLPVVPIVPLMFWGIAKLIDLLADPWGTTFIAWFHAVLAVFFVLSIALDVVRLRSWR
jgi:hypothetical protein